MNTKTISLNLLKDSVSVKSAESSPAQRLFDVGKSILIVTFENGDKLTKEFRGTVRPAKYRLGIWGKKKKYTKDGWVGDNSEQKAFKFLNDMYRRGEFIKADNGTIVLSHRIESVEISTDNLLVPCGEEREYEGT